MSPVADLDQALDERRQMEEDLQKRKAEMEQGLTVIAQKMEQLQITMAAEAGKARSLQEKGESTQEEARELKELERKLHYLTTERAQLENNMERLHEALATFGSSCEFPSGDTIDRDLLLEALDDDAGNELYAEGARRYARRLADRVRDGEFD